VTARELLLGALAPELWNDAAVPLGVAPWNRQREATIALARLSRFELQELSVGLADYLFGRQSSDALDASVRTARPTPLGWLIHMEERDSRDVDFEDRRS
jgi:hypothetical protein